MGEHTPSPWFDETPESRLLLAIERERIAKSELRWKRWGWLLRWFVW